MIYLDNSATTLYKPENVINAVTNCLKYNSANPGRSGHKAALNASMIIMRAREKAAEFFGGTPDRIIFTSGCTEALNLAILGNIRHGNVITSVLEHNSVLRPLFELERMERISLTILEPDSDGIISPETLRHAIRDDTYMVALTHTSNVTGASNPVREIGKMLSRTKILFLVDGAQSAGYSQLNIKRDYIDMLAIAGHKGLHGPQGIGALILSEGIKTLNPLRFGGTGTSSESVYQPNTFPEGFESGTPATPLIAGLEAALDFSYENMKNADIIKSLTLRALNGLKKIQGVKLYTGSNSLNGVISFNISNMTSPELCNILDNEYDIAVRGGLHCAPLIHKYMDTLKTGAVRASISTENTAAEIDAFLDAVYEISQGLKE